MSSLPAGWYKDPADTSTQRYWDGEGWLGKAIPADAVPPVGPPPVEAEPPAAPPPVVTPQPQPYAPPQPPPAHPAYGPPPGWQQPPPGWQQPPPGWHQPPPPQGWQQPPPGWQQPPPPQGWQQPPPGWQQPPPGWQQPPPPQAWPYPQPPHAYAMPVPKARPHGMPLAGLGQRLLARLIDIGVVLLLNVVVNGWFVYQWWQDFRPIYNRYLDQVMAGAEPDMLEPTGRMQTLQMTIIVIATLLWLLYEAPAISSRGQTLGKMLMGIKVVGLDSTQPIGFRRAFSRWAQLGMWTLFWWCLVGLVIQFLDSLSATFDPRLRQAWHDKAASTVVVAVPRGAQQTVEAAPRGDIPGGRE
ncbi:putative RDD family membrane protein YckC [Actinoplanes octamycinicus]|uniref:Putative RDD family membrane protein YckC n=1 Tax=Actinoplanes octamycinicus TaxID=135948 RepID=A0A7W7GT30_9ACTN|nr:RDD family protein [Actinoplanes octamycinicus]MBB4737757.1 putative RDD family membrane protein YckC [Actinoplanes octamycinicus]GIE58058.1 hypothetical protein Aoc01nite_34600 [Actinoplanes octamycinicus]